MDVSPMTLQHGKTSTNAWRWIARTGYQTNQNRRAQLRLGDFQPLWGRVRNVHTVM